MRKVYVPGVMILLVFSVSSTRGQSVDPVAGKVLSFPSRLIARLQSRTATLDVRLTRQTESYLDAMQRREQRLQWRRRRKRSKASGLQQGLDGAQDRPDLVRLRQAMAAALEHIQLDIG